MSGGDPLDDTLESGAATLPALLAGRYRILRPLGRGAAKDVYLAHDERLDRDVALALIKGGARDERVRREMQVTGRLGEHPRVVTVHDAGEHEGVTYLVLRSLEGGSLAARLAAAPGGRLPADEVARLGAEVAEALAHAHAHGVVHRDVKPDNVWLDGQGHAVLGDFGVALDAGAGVRLTADRTIVGTLAYLSPEQARGDPASAASDLYGLGATLYELACGRPPFKGETAAALIAQHLHALPPPPSQHEPHAAPLDGLLLRLLAKDPAQRPPSAAAVREELAGRLAPASSGPDLIGREGVMAELTAALDESLAGRVRVIALVGEPGIGKTHCVEALAERAGARGCRVAWGTCSEEEAAPAYWPWRQALRAAGADVSALSGGEARADESPTEGRFRLLEAVGDALAEAAARQPLLIVLEDAHWADPSSLALLHHLARTFRSGRLLVICTVRTPGSEPAALDRVAGAGAFARVEVGALDREGVARLAERIAGQPLAPDTVDALAERTLGNPLYLAELVRSLAAEGRLGERRLERVPTGLRAVISARVGALPAPARELLAAAAVAGMDFALADVARVTGGARTEAVAAFEPAIAAAVAEPAGPGHRFCHAVIRDVVYEEQPVAHRAQCHAALLDVLEQRGDVPAAELAHHAVMAARGGWPAEPAVAWSRVAADEASSVYAHAEAADHLARALEAAELTDALSARDRLDLRLELAAARAAAGDLDHARAEYRRAADLAMRLEEVEALGRAALGFAEFQDYGVTDEPALALLEQTLRRLPRDDSVLRAEILGRLAVRMDAANDQPRREQLLEEAVAMARRIGEPRSLARLLALSPLVYWPRPERGERRLADAQEVVELAAAGGDREAALWAYIVLHAERFSAGDIAGADAELAAYERHARTLRQPYYRWYGTVLRATRAMFDGRLEEGARLARAAVGENRRHEADAEQEWVVQELLLARLRGRRDDVPLAALADFAERYAHLPLWQALRATGEWTAGDLRATRATFESLAAPGFATLPADADRLCTLVLSADVCAAIGDAQRARELYPLLRDHADRNVLTDRSWAAWGAAARPLGRLAAVAGDAAAAARAFDRAIELHTRWHARPWLAHTLLDRAEALGGADESREGRALAAELGLAHIPSSTNPAQ